MLRRLIRLLVWTALLAAAAVVLINIGVVAGTTNSVYHRTDTLPDHDCALILGASPSVSGRTANPHFQNRVAAGLKLFRDGSVKRILASGDAQGSYNESATMKRDLVAAGVPADKILTDEAGFRTLDSIVRALNVYHLTNVVIVTDEFHAYRAVFTARHFGLNASAFCSDEVKWEWSARTRLREYLARVQMVLDLYFLRTQPATLSTDHREMRAARERVGH